MTKIIEYGVYCDGFLIKKIELPEMSQNEMDEVRREIAKDHSVPSHYLRFKRTTRAYVK